MSERDVARTIVGRYEMFRPRRSSSVTLYPLFDDAYTAIALCIFCINFLLNNVGLSRVNSLCVYADILRGACTHVQGIPCTVIV